MNTDSNFYKLIIWLALATGALLMIPLIKIISINGFFIMLFVVSALLFRYVAQEQPTENGAGTEG